MNPERRKRTGNVRIPWRLLPAIALAAVFAYAAVVKIADLETFARAIENYRLLPPAWSGAAAVLLPWLELGAAFALLAPGWRRAGALLALGLALVFCIAVGSAWVRGLDINCGCFGAGSGKADWGELLLNAALMAAAVSVLTEKSEIE